MNSYIDYYASIIPDLDGLRALTEPLPQCFWVNELKISASECRALLQQDNIKVEPLTWHPSAFRCDPSIILGKHWTYLAGLIQIQEEVSMLPGILLDPKPGEKILDLCAAPGNKTAQLAVGMQNQGTLIANDRNYGRMRAMGQIIKRLGLMNISLTIYDGVNYPTINNYFDKVLVDAPCSCEGTYRKAKNKVVNPNPARSRRTAQVQKALLAKAVHLCKPGGKIIYSTCTFSPEENEAVVDAVLTELKNQVRVVPINVPGFKACEGVRQWQGKIYADEVKKTLRVWPHLNNTGGFYVAMLQKLEGDAACNVKEIIVHESQEVQPYLDEVAERFAMSPEVFNAFRFSKDSTRGFYMTNQDNLPPKSLKKDSVGLFSIKTNIRFPKLSTSAAMLLGANAAEHKVELTELQRDAYLLQQDFVISEGQAKCCKSTGYILVHYQGVYLGVAIFFENGLRVRSLFPKYLQGP